MNAYIRVMNKRKLLKFSIAFGIAKKLILLIIFLTGREVFSQIAKELIVPYADLNGLVVVVKNSHLKTDVEKPLVAWEVKGEKISKVVVKKKSIDFLVNQYTQKGYRHLNTYTVPNQANETRFYFSYIGN